MEIGPDKTKMMTKNPNGFQREIKIKGQRLEEVENFKYPGAITSNEGSKPETLSRIAQTTAALSRLKIIWREKHISLASKVKLMRTLILSTFLYSCESWTLTAEIERRSQALEMRCYWRLLNISYKDHVTNEEVRNIIQNAMPCTMQCMPGHTIYHNFPARPYNIPCHCPPGHTINYTFTRQAIPYTMSCQLGHTMYHAMSAKPYHMPVKPYQIPRHARQAIP